MDNITRKMEHAIEKEIFPGAVLLCATNQTIVYHKAFGLADMFEKKKMLKGSIFDLASLTKPLATTLAVTKMMEKDKTLLDQSIGNILKVFKNTDKAEITIEMLLRHTSGFPAHRKFFTQVKKVKKNPQSRLRQLLVNEPLVNPIGKKEVYSDLGFMVLAWIIEILTHQGLDKFVFNQVYRPLGINHLFFIPFEKRIQLIEQYAEKLVATQDCSWRKKLLFGEVDDENAWAAGGVEGHAGLFGDAISVFTLCSELMAALLNRPTKVLSSTILNRLVQKKQGNDKVAGFDTPSKVNSSSGHFFSESSIGHLGFTGTSFWMDPKTSLIVILLTNRIHPSRSNELIKNFRPQIHDLITAELL